MTTSMDFNCPNVPRHWARGASTHAPLNCSQTWQAGQETTGVPPQVPPLQTSFAVQILESSHGAEFAG